MLLNLYRYEIPDKRIIRYFVGVEEKEKVICLKDDRLETIGRVFKGDPSVKFEKVQEIPRSGISVYTSFESYESHYGSCIKLYKKRTKKTSEIILFNPLVIKDVTHRRMVRQLKESFRQLAEDTKLLPEFLLLLNMCLTISGLSQTKETTVIRSVQESKKRGELDPLCFLWFLLGIDSIYDDLSDSQSESVLLISSATKNYFSCLK